MCTVVSLFSGIGGIDLGFAQAGFDIIWANEKDSAACRTYRHNFEDCALAEDDIRKIDALNIPNSDVLTAGFPCQPFSKAGFQKGFNDCRGTMFFEIARVIANKKPRIVFLENVDNLMNHDNGKTLLIIFNTLADLGYSVKYKVMSPIEYANLPQTRKRIFIIAFLDDRDCDMFKYPETVKLTRGINDIINIYEKKNDIYYYNEENKIYNYLKRSMYDKTSIYRIRDTAVIRVREHKCPTLTANMGTYPDRVPVIWDKFGIRKLTLRECLDFQGFPKNFYFPNTITICDAYKQIGNSVCIPIIKILAEAIRDIL